LFPRKKIFQQPSSSLIRLAGETITRVAKKLEKMGLIVQNQDIIYICDYSALDQTLV
jgi:hypothetical protein